MKWNPDAPMAPLDARGNMHSYADYGTTMQPMPNFYARLSLVGVYRGRSSALFVWKNTSSGVTYPMFLSDLEYVLKNHEVYGGDIPYSQWKVVKRGSNYGIALVITLLDELNVERRA